MSPGQSFDSGFFRPDSGGAHGRSIRQVRRADAR
jgi:hypothetical protein